MGWDCELCGRPIDIEDIAYKRHEVCRDEIFKRSYDGICMKCGENKTTKAYCDSCNNDSPYKNYPGPQ